MPRIVAHARTIDQAVATENPTVAAKPLKNYWKYFGILFIIILSQSVNFRVINAFIPISGLASSVQALNKVALP